MIIALVFCIALACTACDGGGSGGSDDAPSDSEEVDGPSGEDTGPADTDGEESGDDQASDAPEDTQDNPDDPEQQPVEYGTAENPYKLVLEFNAVAGPGEFVPDSFTHNWEISNIHDQPEYFDMYYFDNAAREIPAGSYVEVVGTDACNQRISWGGGALNAHIKLTNATAEFHGGVTDESSIEVNVPSTAFDYNGNHYAIVYAPLSYTELVVIAGGTRAEIKVPEKGYVNINNTVLRQTKNNGLLQPHLW